MCAKVKEEAQNPLILRCHRLMEAFAKSDDERDFYIDRMEGFLLYVDLDKPQEELNLLEDELSRNSDRYCSIPKLSFYETKKIMEGFVNEKVYDIDTKEKLLDIIQSKEARENFLEFIFDHHAEQEKWQLFYQERSRIRIIEWLRLNHFHFVFEEDLDLPRQMIEKLKQFLFQPKVGKDILGARKTLFLKAKTYYSNEALNPRPKRGRPPKQAVKPDIEPQVTIDIYTTVPSAVRPFLFSPDLNQSSSFSAFSSKFDSEEDLLANRRLSMSDTEASLSQKLSALRNLSSKWMESSAPQKEEHTPYAMDNSFDDEEEDEEDDIESEFAAPASLKTKRPQAKKPTKAKLTKENTVKTNSPSKKNAKPPAKSKNPPKLARAKASIAKPAAKRIIPFSEKASSQDKKKPPLKKILPKGKTK